MGFVKADINEEKIDKLKEEYVLTVLDIKGIDIDEFKNSKLYCSSQKKLFFNHLYYVFHGYLDGKYKDDCNKAEIDLNQLKVTFENNILEIIYADINYKYCIINEMLSIDGEKTLGYVATVNAPEIPLEKQFKAMRELYKDIESRKKRTQDALRKSWDFAKEFKVR